VALILHISDLHLSEITEEQITGDYKLKGLVPLVERQNRISLLRASLSALATYLSKRQERLDAVVITGDVSLRHDESGFVAIEETLAALGDQRPANNRILLVPGNHDVKWGSEPSSVERYDFFARYVRPSGFVTPFLEGIDLTESGNRLATPTDPVLSLDNCVVIALNSSNYCGSLTKLSAGTSRVLQSLSQESDEQRALVREIEALRVNDVARVSEAQLIGLRQRLKHFPPPSQGGPMRILALHHQLLPVTRDEEFKPFETVTNLGQLCEFIASQEFCLVLHGHKHVSASYLDSVALGRDNAVIHNEALVSCCATVWRQLTTDHEFARLVRIPSTYLEARRLDIESVPATSPGAELPGTAHAASWTEPIQSLMSEISGRTVDMVYDRLMVKMEGAEDGIENLACVIDDGASARTLPRNYPPLVGIESGAAWLAEIVGWWQQPEPGVTNRVERFNHGERIRHFHNRIDQIDSVVEALKSDIDTTRAYVQIIDQTKDDIGNTDQRFPSFAAIHFLVSVEENVLKCIGYFRKQQMRMWWPVNVAEIASLQEEVRTKLNTATGRDLRAGSITTFSALAVDGTNRPRLIVPTMDRLTQGSAHTLWALVYDIFDGGGDVAQERFLRLFDDWMPTGTVERDGTTVSLVGLDVLGEAVGLFAERKQDAEGRELASELRFLSSRNAAYAASEDRPQEASHREIEYARWSSEVGQYMTRISRLVRSIAMRYTAG
jgi:3',5'-cyclic AMP phosphodiesterase CpdA